MLALRRGSESSVRTLSCEVASQGVVPSQVRVRGTPLSGSRRASRPGGGANGHVASRGEGNSGRSSLTSVPVVFSVMGRSPSPCFVVAARRRHNLTSTDRSNQYSRRLHKPFNIADQAIDRSVYLSPTS